jgi:hypothetical protein
VQNLEHECLPFETAPALDVVLHPDLCNAAGGGAHRDHGSHGGHGGQLPDNSGPTGYGGPVSSYGQPTSGLEASYGLTHSGLEAGYGLAEAGSYSLPASGLEAGYGDGQASSALLDQVAGHPLRPPAVASYNPSPGSTDGYLGR